MYDYKTRGAKVVLVGEELFKYCNEMITKHVMIDLVDAQLGNMIIHICGLQQHI